MTFRGVKDSFVYYFCRQHGSHGVKKETGMHQVLRHRNLMHVHTMYFVIPGYMKKAFMANLSTLSRLTDICCLNRQVK